MPKNYSATSTTLVIVESPAKCKKIEEYLGDQYHCIASKGHIRAIDGLKSIDTKRSFQPTFGLLDEKRTHVQTMLSIIEQFPKENILIASDDDREGESIAWHICVVFGLPVETTKRVLFHEITRDAIRAAVEAPTRINMSLVYAQHSRQVLDIIVGYTPHILYQNNLL
jgi:DNA topoisomerase-1